MLHWWLIPDRNEMLGEGKDLFWPTCIYKHWNISHSLIQSTFPVGGVSINLKLNVQTDGLATIWLKLRAAFSSTQTQFLLRWKPRTPWKKAWAAHRLSFGYYLQIGSTTRARLKFTPLALQHPPLHSPSSPITCTSAASEHRRQKKKVQRRQK